MSKNPKDRTNRRLFFESLENRNLLALALPGTFTDDAAIPVAVAFDGGEQAFVRGANGHLMFQFGSTAASRTYNNYGTPTWGRYDLTANVTTIPNPTPNPSGRLETYVHTSPHTSASTQNLHVLFRGESDNHIWDLWYDPAVGTWLRSDLVAAASAPVNYVSAPKATVFNGVRQVFYINTGKIQMLASADEGVTWSHTNLHTAAGSAINANVYNGLAVMTLGTTHQYVFYRGGNGTLRALSSVNGGAWQDQDMSTLIGGGTSGNFSVPKNGADHSAAFQAVAYNQAGTGNVGWLFYADGTSSSHIRTIYGVESGGTVSWKAANVSTSASLSGEKAFSAPTVAVDGTNVNVAFVSESRQLLRASFSRTPPSVSPYSLVATGSNVHVELGTMELPLASYAQPSAYTNPSDGFTRFAFTDFGNHLQNVWRAGALPTNWLRLDATAYLEQYSPRWGYGIVNAREAVAMATGMARSNATPTTSQWNTAQIQAEDVWDDGNSATANYTGAGVRVGVMDSGLDASHSDLDANAATGYNSFDGSSSTPDDGGHGTWVSGTIAAESTFSPSGLDVRGVAYDATLVPAKIHGPGGTVGDQFNAINWLANSAQGNVQVINMSYGYPPTFTGDNPPFNAVIAAAESSASNPVVAVMAAGNYDIPQPIYPARMSINWGIAVGASMQNGDFYADYSEAGINPRNFVVAPGRSVLTTNITSSGGSWGYVSKNGTSFAAPHVSGLAALIRQAAPTLTSKQIINVIAATCVPPAGITGTISNQAALSESGTDGTIDLPVYFDIDAWSSIDDRSSDGGVDSGRGEAESIVNAPRADTLYVDAILSDNSYEEDEATDEEREPEAETVNTEWNAIEELLVLGTE